MIPYAAKRRCRVLGKIEAQNTSDPGVVSAYKLNQIAFRLPTMITPRRIAAPREPFPEKICPNPGTSRDRQAAR